MYAVIFDTSVANPDCSLLNKAGEASRLPSYYMRRFRNWLTSKLSLGNVYYHSGRILLYLNTNWLKLKWGYWRLVDDANKH
ncbi:hypothetical protein O181_066267 [Austropuccinia psidii MF-1]|uniref:Uncharacterized protein n=1 Tax=Austropuccinia psidii MF-1 TaxID=1389203 RepID=A0A9Q3EV45_9BASI|nr:hypothetical protein [Austropuccinia psidii MF-1]